MYCMVLLGYGFASVLVPVWGGLMVDHIDLKTGKRQPAMIGGLLSIVFVPAASIQPLIMSTMLSATGYVGGQKHQTAEVAQAIRVATGIIPAVILLAGLGLLMLMPISFAREKEIQQLINEKHTGEAEAVA